jgi:hypothetical protein
VRAFQFLLELASDMKRSYTDLNEPMEGGRQTEEGSHITLFPRDLAPALTSPFICQMTTIIIGGFFTLVDDIIGLIITRFAEPCARASLALTCQSLYRKFGKLALDTLIQLSESGSYESRSCEIAFSALKSGSVAMVELFFYQMKLMPKDYYSYALKGALEGMAPEIASCIFTDWLEGHETWFSDKATLYEEPVDPLGREPEEEDEDSLNYAERGFILGQVASKFLSSMNLTQLCAFFGTSPQWTLLEKKEPRYRRDFMRAILIAGITKVPRVLLDMNSTEASWRFILEAIDATGYVVCYG